jgi:hypothetical protein
MRHYRNLRPLFWPSPGQKGYSILPDIDEEGVRQLFLALRLEAENIKAMYREGQQLAEKGSDPRAHGEPSSESWMSRKNHAWLVRALTSEYIPSMAELQGTHIINQIDLTEGPSYVPASYGNLAAKIRRPETRSIMSKLRWFHPSIFETGVLLCLFIIQTGWNYSTAISLDISSEDRWTMPDPHDMNLVIIRAFKARADRSQMMFSRRASEWSPYRIVQLLIEQTLPLRKTLKRELSRLRDLSLKRDISVDAHIARIEMQLKSPWLFFTMNKLGRVQAFDLAHSTVLNDILKSIIRLNRLDQDYPCLQSFKISDCRDAFIGSVYQRTAFNVLITKLAAQHTDLRSLRHYLNRRRYRAASESAVRRMQEAAFSEIECRRPLDATRLRILVQCGSITEEQATRLSDYRYRTRLGMGCLDPEHPPRYIEPEHREGEICKVQRCLGCEHGVVFEDSMEPLARAYAELVHIQTQISYTAWAGSSLEIEAEALSRTLEHFDTKQVDDKVRSWRAQLQSGEAVVHDTYPSH